MENFTIATPEIESWLNFGLETYNLDFFGICIYQKIWLEKNKKKNTLFLAIFENFEHQFGLLKIKTLQIRKGH